MQSTIATHTLSLVGLAVFAMACGDAFTEALPTQDEEFQDALETVEIEREDSRLTAQGYDRNRQMRAIAVWDLEEGSVEVAIDDDLPQSVGLIPMSNEEGPNLEPEENLKIWLRLIFSHRMNEGQLVFARADQSQGVEMAKAQSDIGTTSRAAASNRPTGSLDLVALGSIAAPGRRFIRVAGWLCDSSNFSRPVPVHIYGQTSVLRTGRTFPRKALDVSSSFNRTSLRRTDVASSCGGNPNHGFDFQASNSCRVNGDNGAITFIEAWGIDITSSGAIVAAGNTNIRLNNPGPRFVQQVLCD